MLARVGHALSLVDVRSHGGVRIPLRAGHGAVERRGADSQQTRRCAPITRSLAWPSRRLPCAELSITSYRMLYSQRYE